MVKRSGGGLFDTNECVRKTIERQPDKQDDLLKKSVLFIPVIKYFSFFPTGPELETD